ncbi:MAG: cytochrome b/b6 domain-containing protein, partial [Acidimicrobiales bacterium]|nr:cytochrome b/b6 domain-containing protein [Acidimicrobiales bacterium]
MSRPDLRTGARSSGWATAGPEARLPRFDRVQRAAHWANAVLFGILILTALPLYFSSLERLVGRHVLIAQIHLWAGVALPVPIVVSLLGPWGARMREDVRRINHWTRSEVRWLRTLGRDAPAVVDKFNPGQKLNAIFVAGAIVVMLGTGAVLEWFGLFPVSWRGGATLVHEVLAFVIVVVVVGHVAFALSHKESLRSMVRGWVTEEWARRHAPAWLDEERRHAPAWLDEERGTGDRPAGETRAGDAPA